MPCRRALWRLIIGVEKRAEVLVPCRLRIALNVLGVVAIELQTEFVHSRFALDVQGVDIWRV